MQFFYFLIISLISFSANAAQANRFWENPTAFPSDLNRAWLATQGNCNSGNVNPVAIAKSRSTNLSLKDRGFSLSEMLDFMMTTPYFPQVNSLDLRNAKFTENDLIQLNKLTPRMTKVTDLYLSGSSFEDKRTLINLILINLGRKLEILDLSNINLNANEAGMLAGALHGMPNLRILYLNNNNIGDAGFNRLMNGAFSNLPKLQILGLKATNLTDSPLKRFAMTSFPLMKNLQILDLRGNDFSKNTTTLLMRTSFYLPQLAVLNLGPGNEGLNNEPPSALISCSTISSQSFVDSK